jgi:hypothetical protein
MGTGSGARRRRRAPSLARTIGVAATVVALLAFVPAADASSSEELWRRFDRASQAHADAEEQLADVQLQLAQIERSLDSKRQTMAGLRDEVRRLAVDRYVRGSGGGATDLFSLQDANEGAYLEGLAGVVSGLRVDVIDAFDTAEEDLEADLRIAAELREQRETAVATSKELLADLADAARQAAAAEAAARAEAARQAALRQAEQRAREDAARRARARAALAGTTTTTRPGARPASSAATTRPPATTPPPTSPPVTRAPLDPNGLSEAQLLALRTCESGNNYANTSNSRYRGAYQFHRRTWDGAAIQAGRPDLVGVDPAAASPADQDAMTQALYRSAGLRPWPTCGRRL